jgi:hypothetical protein
MVELARASVRNIPRPAIARLNSCLFQAGASASAGASPQRRATRDRELAAEQNRSPAPLSTTSKTSAIGRFRDETSQR